MNNKLINANRRFLGSVLLALAGAMAPTLTTNADPINERSSVIGSALVVKVGAIAPARARRTLPRNRRLAFISLLFITALFGSSKSSCYLSRENSTPLSPVCLVASAGGGLGFASPIGQRSRLKIHVVAPLHRPIPAACRKPAAAEKSKSIAENWKSKSRLAIR